MGRHRVAWARHTLTHTFRRIVDTKIKS